MSEEEMKKAIKALEPVFPTFAGAMMKVLAENERLKRLLEENGRFAEAFAKSRGKVPVEIDLENNDE